MPEQVPFWVALTYVALLSLAGLAVIAYAARNWLGKMELSVLAWTVSAALLTTFPFLPESPLSGVWTLVPAGVGIAAGFWNWRIARRDKDGAGAT